LFDILKTAIAGNQDSGVRNQQLGTTDSCPLTPNSEGESMGLAKSYRDEIDRERLSIAQIPGEAGGRDFKAWELIDTGRYMPRRIRGSFRGRELG
jgi:hypothetical protein